MNEQPLAPTQQYIASDSEGTKSAEAGGKDKAGDAPLGLQSITR